MPPYYYARSANTHITFSHHSYAVDVWSVSSTPRLYGIVETSTKFWLRSLFPAVWDHHNPAVL